MGSEPWPVLRRAVTPFLAGAAATAALLHGLYATATLSLLVALWAAALIQQAMSRRVATHAPVPSGLGANDAEERRRLTLYLDLSPAPLVALDRDDRLRVINRAARRLLAAEDLVEMPPAKLVEAIAATPPGRSGAARLDAGGGERAFALLTADLDAASRAVRVAALVDIEADLKAAEAATLRDLVQVLGHEITNTLTPIASLSATAAAMLAEPGVDLRAVRSAIETVARRAEGLQRFGEAYRDLARLPPPTIARVDVTSLIGDLAMLFATRWPAATLHVAALPPSVRVNADADQLSQALWALLQNAAEVADAITVAVEARATEIAIRVSDNGPGIAPGGADAIFRPFFTTKPAGSGVGLALARQVLRGHGGDLVMCADTSTTFEAVIPNP